MTLETTKESGPGAVMPIAVSGNKTKRKTPLFLKIVGGFFAVSGIVAPNVASRIATRLLFSPVRMKSPEAARSVLEIAKVEELNVGEHRVRHYIWGESGPRVLLVHGWSGDAGQMTGFVGPLLESGYQVIAIDMPGHGKSSGTVSSVVHFERCISNAGMAYGPFQAVVAHSLGAAATAYALSRGLRCERVIFLAPVGKFESVWKNSQRMLNLPSKVMPLIVRRAERWLDVSFADIDPVKLAPSFSMPLLVVHDRADRECPFDDGASLVSSWADARMLATDKMGHTRALRDAGTVQQVVEFVSDRVS